MALPTLLCLTLGIVATAIYFWWGISRRGPRKNLMVEHREPGYRAWLDDTPIPAPRYGAIMRVLGTVIAISMMCAGLIGFNLAPSGGTSESDLPTRVAIEIETETPTPDGKETATHTPESETATPTEQLSVTTPDGGLVVLPTYTHYPTHTPYPTWTESPTLNFNDLPVVEVERVVVITATGQPVVAGSAVVREQPRQQPPAVYQPPPPVQQPPPIFIPPSQAVTPIVVTATPAPTEPQPQTPSPSATTGVCATGEPQMFMSPTPPGEWWLPCYTPTPPSTTSETPEATPILTHAATITVTPSGTPTLTQTATITVAPSATPSPTQTATITVAPSATATPTQTATITVTPSVTMEDDND